MARIAVALLRDPALRREMSRAARDCWQQRFTLEQYRSEIICAIERAASI
jgi:hypothetical protein